MALMETRLVAGNGERMSADASLLLSYLPLEVLLSILSQYCDCKTLASFGEALLAQQKTSKTLNVVRMLDKVLENRFSKLESPNEHVLDGILSTIDAPRYSSASKNSHEGARSDVSPMHFPCNSTTPRLQMRSIVQKLTVLDYYEQIPDVLWCGYMEFKDPMLPDWSAQHARVVLRSAESWSFPNIHAWSFCFPIQIKLVSQAYNFIPVKPRGVISGVSPEDKNVIEYIRRSLERRDQVMTLRYRNDNGFILRIVSPQQARQRLASFFGPDSNNKNCSLGNITEGLVCTWEYPADRPLSLEQRFDCVSKTLWSYRTDSYDGPQ